MKNKVKSRSLNVRASEELLRMIKELAEKKGLSQANLIDFLIRNEYEKNKNPAISGGV